MIRFKGMLTKLLKGGNVIQATEKTVTVRQLNTTKSEKEMRGKTTPIPGSYSGQPMRRKVITLQGEEMIKIDDAYAHLWDGKPQEFTTYA